MVEKLPVKNRRGVAGGDGETLFLGAGQPPLAAITNYCVTESRLNNPRPRCYQRG